MGCLKHNSDTRTQYPWKGNGTVIETVARLEFLNVTGRSRPSGVCTVGDLRNSESLSTKSEYTIQFNLR